MKTILFLPLLGLLLISCFRTTNHPYVEKCPDINIQKYPIQLQGFQFDEVDTVIIKTFKRNTGFKSLVQTIYCFQEKNGREDSPTSVSSPQQLWTSFDLQILVGDGFVFNVDSFVIKSEPHVTMTTSDYECEVVEYRLNGKMYKSKNIYLWKPGTVSEYPY